MIEDAAKLKQKIFSTLYSFEEKAFSVFEFQYKYNKIYREFVDYRSRNISAIDSIEKIPFLPIQFFKTHKIYTSADVPNLFFESSGTTQQSTSKHYIYDIDCYEKSFIRGFNEYFGSANQYTILALLPNYLERKHSSLVYMFDKLITLSESVYSGFYLNDYDALNETLDKCRTHPKKTILLGVSYALLDLAEQYPQDLAHCQIIETGGMKGKRKELIKEELYDIVSVSFKVKDIYSEYGMTELFSQAYATNGKYRCSENMRIFCRDIYQPTEILDINQRGALNIIDLNNLYSCSFIATDDIGIKRNALEFELIGRIDNSDIRGCNLMLN